MDISGIGRVNKAYNVKKSNKTKKTEKTKTADNESLKLSKSAKDFSLAMKEAMKAPEVREEKIAEAKEDLAKNNISYEEVVKKMLSNKQRKF